MRVWTDPWLPTSFPFRPVPGNGMIDLTLKVGDLIEGPRKWNENLVRNLFSPDEADVVLTIALSN